MTRPARLLAAALLAACAAIHLYLVLDHTDADHTAMGHAYVGWLFAIGAGALLCAVVGLLVGHQHERWWRLTEFQSWNLGALVCAGMMLALLASRTVGLPNGYHEAWEPLAVWSLATELGFLVLFTMWVIRRRSVAPVGSREGR